MGSDTAKSVIFERCVQIALVGCVLFLGWQWRATALPEPSRHVAAIPSLHDDVFAVLTLYPRAIQHEVVKDALSTYGFAPSTQTIAIDNSGRITSLSSKDRHQVVINQTRPRAWFLPTTIGVVSFRSSDGAITLPLRSAHDSLYIPITTESFEPIELPLPSSSYAGSHIMCRADDCIVPPEFSGIVPLASLYDADVFLGDAGEITIGFSDDVSLEQAIDFAQDSQARREPKTISSQLPDGTPIREHVVNDRIESSQSSELGSLVHTLGTGSNSWHVAQTLFGIVATTSRNTLNDYLSTLSLTNEICGRRISFFSIVDSSQSLANNRVVLGNAGDRFVFCNFSRK